jgi:hypothetical protein
LKKIIDFQKGKPRWDLRKLYAERQKVQDTLKKKHFVQQNVKLGM